MIESIPYVLTGIGIIISIFYYTSVLQNANKTRELQLKTQELAIETRQAQLFTQYALKFQEEYTIYSEIVMIWQYDNWDDFVAKYGRTSNNPKNWDEWNRLITFLEGLGVLVKRNLTSKNLVADFMSGFIVRFWEKYEPLIMELRERYEWPTAYEYIELLYDEVKPLDHSITNQ